MGMFDKIEGEAKNMMEDPQKRAKIEQIAKEKGLTIDQAKEHFLKHGDEQ